MCPRCTAHPDAANDVATDFNRQTAAKYEDFVIHLPQRLKRRNFPNQFCQFRGRPAKTCRCIGLFPAALDRMGPGSIGPSLAVAQNRRGLVIYVAARPVDRAPRGLGRTPGGCLIVVPGQVAGRRPLLEVAGCFGYPAGRHSGGAAVAALEGAA